MTHPRRSPAPKVLTIEDDGENEVTVTAAELKVLIEAYAADHGGVEALPRRGARGAQADGLPPGWSRPYWHLIGKREHGS